MVQQQAGKQAQPIMWSLHKLGLCVNEHMGKPFTAIALSVLEHHIIIEQGKVSCCGAHDQCSANQECS